MNAIDLPALSDLLLRYLHLLAFAAAAVGVVLADIALLGGRGLDAAALVRAQRVVWLSLLALWVSGLLLFTPATGMPAHFGPKMQAKLVVVIALSLNGAMLHRWGFPRLLAAHDRGTTEGLALPVALGAFSLTSWLYATFLGVAGPLSPALGLPGFLAAYLLALLLGVTVGQFGILPWLARRWAPASPQTPAAP